MSFELYSDYSPAGDQPQAIEKLVDGLTTGLAHQTLLGVTGSGKTFTIANVIQQLQRPTLVLAHNKTLAAQLYGEFKTFFPKNAVEYFVSYYDYYQPEAYVPASDTFIEKDASINEHIEQMRLSATKALLERPDSIIVATVSAIYGLGDPQAYLSMVLHMSRGDLLEQRKLLRRLADMQYTRNEIDLQQGTYRVRGDVIDIFPAESEREAVRVELFDDRIETLSLFDPLTGEVLRKMPRLTVYPSTHYVTPRERIHEAVDEIRDELRTRLNELNGASKLVEAQRLQQRTLFDLEMMNEVGYCAGIENYSRYLSGRQAGEPPPCLFDYLPSNALLVIDESHQTIPQLGAMYKGDRSRKETLVEYGFRLPSALDNRPLRFEEFERHGAADDFHLRHAGSAREAHLGADRGTGGAPDRAGRSRGRGAPGARAGGRSVVRDTPADARQGAGAGHDAHQAHGGGSDRLLERAWREGALPAFGHRNRRTLRDHPRSEARQVRRDRRHQSAARGTGHARGVAGRHSRRRQGGLPAFGGVADPDHRPRRAQRPRQGDPVRRYRSRARSVAPSPKPIGAATSRSNSMSSMASRPRTIVKAVGDVMEGARAVPEHGVRDAGLDYAAMAPEQAVKRIKKLEADMMKLARNLEFEQAARLRDEIQKLRQSAFGAPSTLAG